MGRLFLTGDTHGAFNRIMRFTNEYETTTEDILCILGDAGINYWLDERDYLIKGNLKDLPITLFCVQGNHEQRPFEIDNYKVKMWNGGLVYYEEEYPNLIFAKDGEIYEINGKKIMVIGGAYSVDKNYRILTNMKWFPLEQPTNEIKEFVEKQVEKHKKVDLVLSHTCPTITIPTHMFLSFIDQDTVDKSTEEWLQLIANKLEFTEWYFGHYHDDWDNGKYHMLFESYKEII